MSTQGPHGAAKENALNFVACTHEAHAGAILEIFNDAIVNSTALLSLIHI